MKKSAMKTRTRDTIAFFLFISPWLIGFVVFTIVPMLASLFISFTDWNILTPPVWSGTKNFQTIFSDPLFYKSIQVTLTYTLFSVPLNIILSIFVAMLLNNALPGMRLFRTIFYLPAIVSGVVISVIWLWIYNPDYGLINGFLAMFGIEGPGWVYDENWALPSLIIMSLWGIGTNIVLYLAGLQSISTEFYEAAHIDGANFWQRLIYITLPSMSPVLLFTTLTGIINSLQTFTQAFIMTDGGPNNATNFYAYYIYNNAFVWRKMGEACAQAWILFIIIFILTMITLKVSNGHVHYGNKEDGKIV